MSFIVWRSVVRLIPFHSETYVASAPVPPGGKLLSPARLVVYQVGSVALTRSTSSVDWFGNFPTELGPNSHPNCRTDRNRSTSFRCLRLFCSNQKHKHKNEAPPQKSSLAIISSWPWQEWCITSVQCYFSLLHFSKDIPLFLFNRILADVGIC